MQGQQYIKIKKLSPPAGVSCGEVIYYPPTVPLVVYASPTQPEAPAIYKNTNGSPRGASHPQGGRGTRPISRAPAGISRGFTLIELVVTIAIASVLIAVAVPYSQRYMANYRLNSAATEVVVNMQLAKTNAVRRNANCIALFDPESPTPAGKVGSYLVFLDENGNWLMDAGEEVLVNSVNMPANVSLYQATFTANGSGDVTETKCAGFTPSGLAARSASGAFVSGEVRLKNNFSKYVRVAISPAGGVTVEKSTDGVTWN